MVDKLNQLELAVLACICTATGGSKSAHVPEQYFMRKFQKQMKMANRSLHRLISLGYVAKHPTGGEMTYELTQRGFEVCRAIRDQLRNLK